MYQYVICHISLLSFTESDNSESFGKNAVDIEKTLTCISGAQRPSKSIRAE